MIREPYLHLLFEVLNLLCFFPAVYFFLASQGQGLTISTILIGLYCSSIFSLGISYWLCILTSKKGGRLIVLFKIGRIAFPLMFTTCIVMLAVEVSSLEYSENADLAVIATIVGGMMILGFEYVHYYVFKLFLNFKEVLTIIDSRRLMPGPVRALLDGEQTELH